MIRVAEIEQRSRELPIPLPKRSFEYAICYVSLPESIASITSTAFVTSEEIEEGQKHTIADTYAGSLG